MRNPTEHLLDDPFDPAVRTYAKAITAVGEDWAPLVVAAAIARRPTPANGDWVLVIEVEEDGSIYRAFDAPVSYYAPSGRPVAAATTEPGYAPCEVGVDTGEFYAVYHPDAKVLVDPRTETWVPARSIVWGELLDRVKAHQAAS